MPLPTPLSVDLDSVAPGDLFDQLLAGNPEVCRRCFTRLRRTSEIPRKAGHKYHDRSCRIQRHLPEGMEEPETTEELQEVAYTATEATEHSGTLWVHEEPVSEAELSFCASCGAVGEATSMPPDGTRSAAQLLWASDGIELTLRDYGVAFDGEELTDAIEELAVQPDWAGDDHGLLTEAVRRAHLAAIEE